jgi:hypothetical protein
MFFSSANRERIKEENEGCTFGEIGKYLGADWATKTADEKAPYEKQAGEDKARYEEDMKTYVAPDLSDDDTADNSKKKKKKDPNAPKKQSAYMFYCAHARQELSTSAPETKNTDVMKIIGQQWKALDDSDKEVTRANIPSLQVPLSYSNPCARSNGPRKPTRTRSATTRT